MPFQRRLVSMAGLVLIFVLTAATAASAAAPTQLTDEVDTSASLSFPPVIAGGQLFFVAADGEHGQELWVSDGSAENTHLVKDIQEGIGSSIPRELTNVNGTLYFVANNGANGEELWRSDGTPEGTTMVEDIRTVPFAAAGSNPNELANVGGTLYFAANDGEHGHELWRSDAEGTAMVKDIYSEGASSSQPRELSDVDGTLLFRANDGVSGEELWRSDGTEKGTTLVADIYPGSVSSFAAWRNPPFITRRLYGAPLYFRANDPEHGNELWRTDGTTKGTELVRDINPGTFSSSTAGYIRFGGTTFFIAEDGEHGVEPWGANESEGAYLLKDIDTKGSSFPTARAAAGGVVYFTANDGDSGYELWRSEGEEPNTKIVTDLNPFGSAFVSGPLPLESELANVNGTIFFNASDGLGGEELWETRGNAESTRQVADLNPLAGSSAPRKLTSAAGDLYFFAEDGTAPGRQLWVLSTGLGDSDGDGIADEIDLDDENPSTAFSDEIAPTYGEVEDPGDLDLTIASAADTDGVRITAGPGTEEATLSMCGGFTLKVAPSSEVLATCGSLTVKVIEGEAKMVVGGGSIVVSISQGGTAKVSEDGEGSFTVENLGDTDVTVAVDGEEQTVGGGGTTVVEEPVADVPPSAVDDAATVDKDSGANPIDVLANDTDPDGGPIEVIVAGGAANGTVAIAPGGADLAYEPDYHYCGPDSFTYTLNGGSSAAVAVEVRCGHHYGQHKDYEDNGQHKGQSKG